MIKLALIEGDNEVCRRYRIEGFEQAMAWAKPTRLIWDCGAEKISSI
ncbi:MAG: hypothetical protein ABSG67_16700 [Thermoguttaceae bacterium]|jgi:hypothetical protein